MELDQKAMEKALSSLSQRSQKALNSVLQGMIEDYIVEAGISSTLPDGKPGEPNEPSEPQEPQEPIEPSEPSKDFLVFDQLRYDAKPRAASLGMHKIKILYQSAFEIEDNGSITVKTSDRIAQLARDYTDDLIVLDIEHDKWIDKDDWSFRPDGPERFLAVLHIWRRAMKNKDQRVGLYGITTARAYWPAVRLINQGPEGKGVKSWRDTNDLAKSSGIVDEVDDLFPSLYTFADETFEDYAIANIGEAKRTRKSGQRVIPFLWPQWHGSAVDRSMRNKPVDGKLWRRQLEVCREHADGVVLWTKGSDTKKIPFADIKGMGWWKETEAFIRTL